VLFASGVFALRRTDFLLASYPRSGSTWTRHVLCNLISLEECGGREVGGSLNDTMPALGTSNLLRQWRHGTVPRVVKTHSAYSPLFGRTPAIGLTRDPRDVMVSRYHLVRDRLGSFDGTFAEFIRHPSYGLDSWFRHYLSWRDRWILVLRYEDLLANPRPEFDRLLRTLRVSCPDELVDEAIERSSFQHMRQVEQRRRPTATDASRFYRAGSSGQWSRYFDDADEVHLAALAARYGVELDGRGVT
jgi:hypothetical protein